MNESVKSLKLSTNRLELIASTLEYVCAEIESPERLAYLLNVQAAPGWPPGEYDRAAQEFFRDRMQEGNESVIGWYVWYAILRKSLYYPSLLVGAGGYFGPPLENGEVEIGFSVISSRQGMGYATEIASALVKNAFSDSRVKKIIANTIPLNLASCKVLKKCGFNFICRDEESGNNRFEIIRLNFCEKEAGQLFTMPVKS